MAEGGHASKSRVLTLVFTDLAGSTALKSELGDRAVGSLIARHRAHIERLSARNEGRIIDWAGDGCFLTFETSSGAVLFALELQQAHAAERDLPAVRIGVHIGEVTETLHSNGAPRIEGLAVDLAARVSALARPGQVLMSSSVFNNVRQRIRGEDLGVSIAWRAHGPYELKGFADPMEICEAGVEGIAPLEPPVGSEKAHRTVRPAEEETLGWRPAVGLHVPRRDNWVLEAPLGEGGFGEVWLAIHEKTKAKRVFKFCFEAERVRGLKREVVLFRLLKESLGQRDDIAQIIDWEFERPPYFLESEYTEGGDLRAWAAARGGLDRVPLDTRLELVAQVAVALGAAHSVGVLHKDIKPGNILITEVAGKDKPRVSLTDFGIGLITDPGALAAQGITAAGITLTSSGSSTSDSGAGTRMYMAPELIEGKPATTLSDIYALGVVLYQMVLGNLSHAVGSGWERDIADELLREDIAACLDGDPGRRLKSAEELAERIRGLDSRRAALHKQRAANRRRRMVVTFSAIGPVITLLILAFAFQQTRLAGEANRQREAAEAATARATKSADEARAAQAVAETLSENAQRGEYVSNMRLAASYLAQQNQSGARALLIAAPAKYRQWEWGRLVELAWPNDAQNESALPSAPVGKTAEDIWLNATPRLVTTLKAHSAAVGPVSFHPDGKRVATSGADGALRIWDLATGKELWHDDFNSGPISLNVISPDGLLIAFSTQSETGTDSRPEVKVCNFDSGAVARQLSGHNDQCAPVAFSEDSTKLCTSGFDRTYRIWDVRTGDALGVYPLEGDYSLVADAVFIPGTTQILLTDTGNRLVLWDYVTQQKVRAVKGQGADSFSAGRISPDRKSVMSWSAALSSTTIWDAESGVEQQSFSLGQSLSALPGLWSADGTMSLFRGLDWVKLGFKRSPTGFPQLTSCGPYSGQKPGAISKDGALIAVPEQDGTVRIFAPAQAETRTGNVLVHGNDVVFAAAYTNHGERLVTASFDGTVQVADARTLQPIREIAAHTKEIGGMSVSPDERYAGTFGFDGMWRVWDLETGAMAFEAATAIPKNFAGGARGPATRISAHLLERQYFSPDSRRVALTTAPGEVTVFDVPSGAIVYKARYASGWSYRNTFSADGSRLVVTPYQVGFATLFDAKTGELIADLKGHAGQVIHSNFSPDGAYVITTSVDRTTRIWDAKTGAFVRVLEGHGGTVFFSGFSPDGKLIVTTSVDGSARLWRAETGEPLAVLGGHSGVTMGAEVSRDMQRILTTGQDNVARVWNLEGQLLAELKLPEDENLYYAMWSPDGRTIVTTTSRGTMRLWRAEDWTKFDAPAKDEKEFEAQLARVREGN